MIKNRFNLELQPGELIEILNTGTVKVIASIGGGKDLSLTRLSECGGEYWALRAQILADGGFGGVESGRSLGQDAQRLTQASFDAIIEGDGNKDSVYLPIPMERFLGMGPKIGRFFVKAGRR